MTEKEDLNLANRSMEWLLEALLECGRQIERCMTTSRSYDELKEIRQGGRLIKDEIIRRQRLENPDCDECLRSEGHETYCSLNPTNYVS